MAANDNKVVFNINIVWKGERERERRTLTFSSADSADSHEYLEYLPDREKDSFSVTSLQWLLTDWELGALGVVHSDLSSSSSSSMLLK